MNTAKIGLSSILNNYKKCPTFFILIPFLLGILSACRTPEGANKWVGVYFSKVPAKATYRGSVDGTIYYRVYSRNPKVHGAGTRPIRDCVLQHGYGVTQQVIDAGLEVKKNTSKHGIEYSPLDLFVSQYFGMPLVDSLLKSACERVIVPVQETNNTTILEMVRRTERFLRDEVCLSGNPVTGQQSCAFVGHSMAGAVAFTIARRCQQGISELGEAGCKSIAKFYSATGVIQGASIPALVFGTKSDDTTDSLDALRGFANSYSKFLAVTGTAVWDLTSDLTTQTNPTWYALSPTHPMENNVPLYLANDWELKKEKWLVGEFAASATQYDFSKNPLQGLVGCGTRAKLDIYKSTPLLFERHVLQKHFCSTFGNSLGLIHTPLNRDSFERGVSELIEFMEGRLNFTDHPDGLARIREALNWQDFNIGDGFADYHLALQACKKGLDQDGNPKRGSAVRKCTTFDSTPLNHQASAGGALEAAEDIVSFLK